MLQCQVNFLDDTTFMWELERNAVGRDLFNKVCEHLDLLERDYYGLAMWDSPNTRGWLDCSKEILKQIKGPEAEFFFNIKFYPPDPSILAEDITRYHLCLQLRKDIMTGRLPCPSDMLAVLGSYTVQSTLGDYDPKLHTNNYVSEIVLAPNQSEELDEKVMEQHATHRSMSPAQADMLFFEYAKTLPMYGLDLHPAKDFSDADVMLGVCSEGLMVFQDEIKTNSYLWPRVLKISHKRNTFLLKIRSSEDELDGDVSFTLPSYRACKQLWKCAVENHSFFRNRLQDTTAKMFLTLGSWFRYNGRTLSECLEASANITRAPPQFSRLATKRKANEEILILLKQPLQTESDDWFLLHDSDKWEVSTTDDVMLESKELWESNQEADDWFVLLESSLFPPSVLQESFENEEQSKVEIVEENESEERTTDQLVIKRSYKVNVAQEGSVELKVMEDLARDIMKKEHPELKEQTMTMKESLAEEILQVNGERIQRVVITKQWTQEINSFVESQEEKEIEVGKLLIMGSEKTSERLEIMEQRLQEVETIDQKLQDVEVLRVGLQEIESLHRAEREGLQQGETADWYILLDGSPSLLTAAPTADEPVNIIKPMERNNDWYILLEMPAQRIKLSASPTAPPSLLQQSFENEEQSKVEIVEENESEERTTDELVIKRSYKVNVAQEGSVELKVMEDLARDIMKKEHPELKEQTMTMKESLAEEILQVNGERIQREVITKQWTQEINSFVESQEEKEIEVGKLLILGSEKTSERLEIMEQRLQEVETIDQKLQDVEVLRVGLQEIESLHRAEREGLQQGESADWYILLDGSPSLLTAAPTADELINIIKPMERNNDWYILLEMPAQRIKLSASPTVPPSVLQQSFENEEQSKVEIVEENESEERTTDELVIKRSFKVNVAQEGSVELKVMEDLARDIMKKEHPELKEQTMTMKESLAEEILQVNGERIQREVITKQWTQEINSFVESQEEKEIEVGKLLILGSEKTSERLEIMEQRLQEVETIDQKLQDVEVLRVGLQEIERLHRAEREGLQQGETADWYILLDGSPSLLTAAPTADELINIIKPMERNNDWYILLEMPAQRIKLSAIPTAPPSLLQQSFENEEQSKVEIVEENESEERTTDELVIKRSYKVNVAQEGSVELKVMEDLARDIMKKEHPELKEQTMTMKESLAEEILQVNGERIQREVITKQWTQEINSFVESQEEKEIEVGKLLILGSEKTSERLEIMEQRLQEVETIYQKLQDVEVLRVGLQEIESLHRAEREGLQQGETADWYILLDGSPSLLTAAPTADEPVNIIKPMERNNDWYILLEMPAQRIKLSASPTVQTDVISTIAGVDQAEEVESREEEKKIQLLPRDKPKTQTCEETSVELYEEIREEVTQSRVRRDKEQVTVEYRRPQPVLPEQQADRPQRDLDDDWFILLDVSPKTSVSLVYPYLRGETVEVYEESREEVLQSVVRREEQESEQIMLEKKATQAQRDVEDDWFIILDVYLKGTGARFVSLTPLNEENRAVERRDEVQNKQHEKVTVDDRRPVPIILEQSAAQVQREREDDWSIILDDSPEASVLTTVEMHEESRETRVRKEERVTEMMTVSTGQTVRTEKMMMKVIQTPHVFPVVPREIDDDWFQMFEQRSITSVVKSSDVVVREPTKDQRAKGIVEKVVEEQLRGKNVLTEERRVVFEEHRERVDVVQQMFPVGVRQVDDDWCELLDTTPFEKGAVLSVNTEKHRMKEQEESRVRDDVETRMRQQEMRKQDLEVRRSQPAVIVQTVAQSHREVEDDWFVVFDVSPKQTVVADVIKVDKRGEEVKRRDEEKKIEDKRRQAEQRRREEERRRQIQVEDRQKRPVGPEKTPVWQQRGREDDWFNLMGVSTKDSVSTRVPVISPVAVPKPRPQIPADQPLTSTPTIQPVSVTKTTYLDRTKDTLDITLESEAEDSVLMRKTRRWTKRIEGENIYVRHSILMLEDFDVTQEVVLRHHASVSELKRVFMEAMEDFGPTEWDRRLSSYSPMPKTQLPHANGDILISMGLIEDGGKTVV